MLWVRFTLYKTLCPKPSIPQYYYRKHNPREQTAVATAAATVPVRNQRPYCPQRMLSLFLVPSPASLHFSPVSWMHSCPPHGTQCIQPTAAGMWQRLLPTQIHASHNCTPPCSLLDWPSHWKCYLGPNAPNCLRFYSMELVNYSALLFQFVIVWKLSLCGS